MANELLITLKVAADGTAVITDVASGVESVKGAADRTGPSLIQMSAAARQAAAGLTQFGAQSRSAAIEIQAAGQSVLYLANSFGTITGKVNLAAPDITKMGEAAKSSGDKLSGVSAQGKQAAGALETVASGAGSAATQLLAVAGVTLSIGGAAYLMKQAWDGWFDLVSGGIKAVDDYKRAIIGAAAHMADLSVAGTPKAEAYGEWTQYFEWLWAKAKEVDQKVAASGREIFEMAMQMAKKGVIAQTTEDVETLGFLMDKLKSVTQGMTNMTGQLHSEVRALFAGTINMHSQLAEALQEIDANFKSNYENARKTGEVLPYLATLLEGIKIASKDTAETWEAVHSTMQSLWQEIQIEAFGEAYKDVVKFAKEIVGHLYEGGQLTEEGRRLAESLGRAWGNVKEKVGGFVDYFLNNSDKIIADIGSMASALAIVAGWAFQAAGFMADMVHALNNLGPGLADLGPLSAAAMGDPFADWAVNLQKAKEEAKALQGAAGGGGGGGWGGLSPTAPVTPGVKAYLGKTEKGGGGGGAAGKDPAEEMEQIVKRLEDAIAHASLERAAMIEREFGNWKKKILEVGASYEQTNEAMVTAGRWRAAQMDKLEKELTKMAIHETEDRYTKLEMEERELRKKFLEGVTDPALIKRFEDQINQIMGSKTKKAMEQTIKDISGLWKQYFDVLAQGDPYNQKTWSARWSRLELEHREKLRQLEDLAKHDRVIAQDIDKYRRNLEEMYFEDARKLGEEQVQYMGGMYQGMTKAATDYYNESTNLYKQGVTLFNQTTAGMETALAGFFEIIIWRTGKFTDVMTNFLKQLSNALIKSLIIQPLVGLISGGLGSLFGGGANSILGGLTGQIGNLIGLGGGGQESVINSAANAPMAGAEVAALAGGSGGGGGGGGNAWLGLLGVGGIGLMAAMMGDNDKGSGGTGTGGSLEKCTVKQMVVGQLVTGGLGGGLGGLGGGSSLGQEGAATVLSGIIKSGNFKGFMADWANAQALENLTADTVYMGSVEISNLQNLGQFVNEAGGLWVGTVEESTSLIEAAGDRLRKNIEDGGMSFQQAAAETGKMLLDNLITAWGQYVPRGPGDYGGESGIFNPLSWFHAGGIIRAHSGVVLGEDERLVIGQVEEGILPAPAMRRLGRRNFEALRTGDFGQVKLAGGDARPTEARDMHVHVHVHALDPNSVSTLNWERIVEGKIAPALKKLNREWVRG